MCMMTCIASYVFDPNKYKHRAVCFAQRVETGVTNPTCANKHHRNTIRLHSLPTCFEYLKLVLFQTRCKYSKHVVSVSNALQIVKTHCKC